MQFDGQGPWELAVEAFEVLHMSFGAHVVDVFAYGPEGITSQIRFEAPFELHEPNGEKQTLDPDSWERLAALFVLRYDTIRVARITKTSELLVEFASGRMLTSSASGPYECWAMHAPDGVMVIGVSGEPTIYDGEPENRRSYRWDGSELNEVTQLERPTPPGPAT